MDIKDLQNFIKFVSKSDVAKVFFETDEYTIEITNLPTSTTESVVYTTPTISSQIANPAPHVVAAPDVAKEETNKYIQIKSPMIGTFYRKPAPDKPDFVTTGDEVQAGKVVCIIEAMKLFNEIESEVSGRIVKCLVEDNSPVEFDQPLFLVDPS